MMDFTQIMQRYIRLRERFEQGEVDADSFEEQVNGMIYKDEQGRYWQIGVQTGLWYYYDGSKWVQDDLIEQSVEEPEEPEIEMAAIDEIFPIEEAEAEEDDEPSPFDMAFEEQLASQFAEGGDSQVFDLFDDTDIFASILKGKGMEADDPLAAPAEEVEGLAEHLETTQPVSIESLMGEGTALPVEEGNGGVDFLFAESENSEPPDIQDGSQIDLAAVLSAGFSLDEEDDGEEISDSELGVRPVDEDDVVTGELEMPVEMLTQDAIDSLMDDVDEVDFGAVEETEVVEEEETTVVENVVPFDIPLEEENSGLDWGLESNGFRSSSEAESADLPDSPMIEVLDDDFSLDDLVADSEQAFLEETQPVPTSTAAEFYEDPAEVGDDEFYGSEDEAPFELPLQVESDELNTVPVEVSAPVGETMHAGKPVRKKRKLPAWVIGLGIFLAVFVIALLILAGWNLIAGMRNVEVPIINDLTNDPSSYEVDDPQVIAADTFDNEGSGWPAFNDPTTGAAGYSSGFYYLYTRIPEQPVMSVVEMTVADVTIDVETTQLNSDYPDTLTTYGVMCRVQDNGDGYSFRITNNGQYVIEKYQSGVFMPINGWKYSDVIKANRDVNKNHIEVICKGTELQLFVNGHLLDLATDGTFTTGKFGFVTQAGAPNTVSEVHYDDLYILEP